MILLIFWLFDYFDFEKRFLQTDRPTDRPTDIWPYRSDLPSLKNSQCWESKNKGFFQCQGYDYLSRLLSNTTSLRGSPTKKIHVWNKKSIHNLECYSWKEIKNVCVVRSCYKNAIYNINRNLALMYLYYSFYVLPKK